MGREIERLLVVFLPCSAIVVRDLIETLSGFKNLFERLENFHVFTFHMFYSQKVPSRYIYIYNLAVQMGSHTLPLLRYPYQVLIESIWDSP